MKSFILESSTDKNFYYICRQLGLHSLLDGQIYHFLFSALMMLLIELRKTFLNNNFNESTNHPKFEKTSAIPIVPQLSRCLKIEAVRGDQTDQMIGT